MKFINEVIQGIYSKTKSYKIKSEWEEQNILIDEQKRDISQLIKKVNVLKQGLESEKSKNKEFVLAGQQVVEEKVMTIRTLEKYIEGLKSKLEKKETARRKLAGRIGGYQARINRLENQVEFLKTNRRAPKLEEIKDYEYKRKKSVTNE